MQSPAPPQYQTTDEATAERTFDPPTAQKTLEWITVLSAAHLDYRLSRHHGDWQLHVPDSQAEAAQAEIRAFEADAFPSTVTPPAPPPSSPQHTRTAIWTAFWLVYTLVWFYLWLGPFQSGNPLHETAAGGGILFRQGGWWRPFTALTLHADLPHLVANIVFLFCIAQAVFRETGHGLGLVLLLGAGALGNLTAAAIASPFQRSVGSSTMGFAALGCMSILQSFSYYQRVARWRPVWKRAWMPIAAGIAMLGIMGTSPNSDLSAHLFGFLSGILLAAPFAIRPTILRHLPERAQHGLAVLAALLLVLAWFHAFQQGG